MYVKIHDNEYILIVCLCVDDLICTSSNPSLFEEFKKVMSYQFKIAGIGLSCYTIWA